jgi:hypothetical protein
MFERGMAMRRTDNWGISQWLNFKAASSPIGLAKIKRALFGIDCRQRDVCVNCARSRNCFIHLPYSMSLDFNLLTKCRAAVAVTVNQHRKITR